MADSFLIRCKSCEKSLKVPQSLIGKTGKCPSCKAEIKFVSAELPSRQAKPSLSTNKSGPSKSVPEPLQLPSFQQVDVPPSGYWQPPTSPKPATATPTPQKTNKNLLIGLGVGGGVVGLLALVSGVFLLISVSNTNYTGNAAATQEQDAKQNEPPLRKELFKEVHRLILAPMNEYERDKDSRLKTELQILETAVKTKDEKGLLEISKTIQEHRFVLWILENGKSSLNERLKSGIDEANETIRILSNTGLKNLDDIIARRIEPIASLAKKLKTRLAAYASFKLRGYGIGPNDSDLIDLLKRYEINIEPSETESDSIYYDCTDETTNKLKQIYKGLSVAFGKTLNLD